MSINDIMKYVSKTPGNTNPSVIASMVNGEMNDTLKEAKEYTDNAFRELGVSVEKEKVYLSGKLEYSSEVGALGATCLVPTTKRHFTVGNSYTVKLDGGTYTGVAKFLEGSGYTYIGNVALMSSDFADMNTGESYCIAEIFVEGDAQETDAGQIFVVDSNNGSNFSIEIISETVHPIDPKFLPGVCLPVVEITSAEYPTDGIVELSAEEITQIDNALCLSSLIIFKFKGVFNDLSIMLPVIMSATPFDVEGITAYAMTNESKDKVL